MKNFWSDLFLFAIIAALVTIGHAILPDHKWWLAWVVPGLLSVICMVSSTLFGTWEKGEEATGTLASISIGAAFALYVFPIAAGSVFTQYFAH